MTPSLAFSALWIGFWASWLIAARWSARTAERPAAGSEILYRVVQIGGFVLLFMAGRGAAAFDRTLWDPAAPVVWSLVAATGVGFAFCWWARVHLGRLWSGAVTRKEGHRVVDTGPYRLVRHPIYTGILIATVATAASIGTALAFAGAALVYVGLWTKARLEEQFLRRELGDPYDAYARRTPMLVPFLPV